MCYFESEVGSVIYIANNLNQPTCQIARVSGINYRTSYAGMLCKLYCTMFFDRRKVYLYCWNEKKLQSSVYGMISNI